MAEPPSRARPPDALWRQGCGAASSPPPEATRHTVPGVWRGLPRDASGVRRQVLEELEACGGGMF